MTRAKAILIADDDIHFLKELAHELRTQDTRATRKPVVWKVREMELVLGIDPNFTDKACLIWDTESVSFNIKDAVQYLTEECELSDLPMFGCLEDIESFCDERDIACVLTGYDYREKLTGEFLTLKALEEHIQRYGYKYQKPQTYCDYAYRNPELERLLRIVEQFGHAPEVK